MAFYRTGVPRREGGGDGTIGTGANAQPSSFDRFGDVEQKALYLNDKKVRNEGSHEGARDAKTGAYIRRWGDANGQQHEQAIKDGGIGGGGTDELDELAKEQFYTEPTSPDVTPPVPDRECCAWLRINAPSTVASGSTSGISAGNRKGCVYYWSIEGCNPSYWGCGAITAAGTGGSGAGVHQTSKGVVFIAPTIPDKETTNCNRTVDTKIKVAILTADGKKQVVAGTGGWSGYGMGPGDELYDLFGPENVCDDTTTITTKAEDCLGCGGEEISFTTQHMPFGATQGLGIIGANPTENYSWVLSGGGTLSKTTGLSTVYKAPDTNYNCDENATIMLKCNGSVVDSIGIAVYNPGNNSYVGKIFHIDGLKYSCCKFLTGFNCSWGGISDCFKVFDCTVYLAFCDGSMIPGIYETTLCRGGICFPVTPGGEQCRTSAEPCYGCGSEPSVGYCPLSPVWNYASLIAAGCCPVVP